MTFIKADKGSYHFQIPAREKMLLFKILNLYPLVPASHQQLSKFEDRPEDQQLLDEALAEQRAKNKKQVLAMLKAKSRFRKNKRGYRFSIKSVQTEWLMQVLNDVRVGSWLALGAPEDLKKIVAVLNNQTAPHFWAMEISGHFQAVFLEAMNGQ